MAVYRIERPGELYDSSSISSIKQYTKCGLWDDYVRCILGNGSAISSILIVQQVIYFKYY